MNTKSDQPVILHAHLDDQAVGQRLGARVTGVRIWVLGHIVQAATSCANEGKFGGTRGFAKKGQRCFIQEHDGDSVDLQDLFILLQRHIFDGVQLRNAGTGDDDINATDTFGLDILDGIVGVGFGGGVDLRYDDLCLLPSRHSEQPLSILHVSHGRNEGIVWLRNIVVKNASTDTWCFS